ncbi:MAG: Fe(3+) ABC transporter substrate-binding protein [Cyanothece sp. SIO2G6]|nr:Fe(3+) ABC transporter substrate-binding protein [Cyanothece sp. SIO2G6]
MKYNRIKLLGTTLATGILMVIAACSDQSQQETATTPDSDAATSAGETTGGTVNVYTARHYEADDALYDRFTEATGIEVNLLEGKSDELIERLQTEGENSPADLFIAVDAGRLWRADEAALFQPIDSDVLNNNVPENLRHPDGMWFGLATRARVIVYNNETVSPDDLSTYEALAEPEWQGRVCIRSSSNIYNQSLLGSMVEAKGVEATQAWAEGIVTNLARQPEGGDTDQIRAVAAGQCDVAITNHYYWARLAKSDETADQEVVSKTAVFFPNQDDRGTHINISGAGVLANAPNQANAIALLEFLVSTEAQAAFGASNNEYPVLAGVEVDPIVSELGDFKVDAMNVSAYGRNNPEVVKLVDRVGWE